MGRSWQILVDLIDSLKTYQETNLTEFDFIYERYAQDEVALNERSDIVNCRIGLYESSSDNLISVSSRITYDVNQSYTLSIFYKVPREGDYDETVEKAILDIKDMVNDWLTVTSFASVTSSQIYTLSFTNNTEITREPSYASMDVNLVAYRNLNTL